MVKHLNPSFDDFPAESHLIFVMLAGYGELEYELMVLVGHALGDLSTAVRTVYRLRSESQRLHVADALINPACASVGLSAEYSQTLGALRWCKNTRNRYAHSHWFDRDGILMYFDMESKAQSHPDQDIILEMMPVDEPLLAQQAEYFRHAARCLTILSDEFQVRKGLRSDPSAPFPKPMQQPRPHNRPP